jgi:hypothetical protein
MEAITIAQGQTLDLPIKLTGAQPSGSDVLLVAVRDCCDNVAWEAVLSPVASVEDGQPVLSAVIQMTHEQTKGMGPGIYSWGVTLYQGAEVDDGRPTGGWPVHVPVPKATFEVVKAVARDA